MFPFACKDTTTMYNICYGIMEKSYDGVRLCREEILSVS